MLLADLVLVGIAFCLLPCSGHALIRILAQPKAAVVESEESLRDY